MRFLIITLLLFLFTTFETVGQKSILADSLLPFFQKQLPQNELTVDTLLVHSESYLLSYPLLSNRIAHKAHSISDSINYESGEIASSLLIGRSALAQDNYEEAIEFYLKCVDRFIKKDQIEEAKVRNDLGMAYAQIGKEKEALIQIRTAQNLIVKEGDRSIIQYSLATLFKRTDQIDSAIHYFEKVNEYTTNDSLRANALIGLGRIYLDELNNKTKSIPYFKEAITSLDASDSAKLSEVYYLLASATLNNRLATSYYLQSIEQAKNQRDQESKILSLLALSEIEKARGNLKKSYDYLEESHTTQNQLRARKRRKEREQVELESEIEQLNKDVVRANEIGRLTQINIKEQTKENQLLILSIILLIVFGISMVIFLRFRQQKNAEVHEKRKKAEEEELKNKKLKEDELKRDLIYKNKELTSYQINLIQKGELFREVAEIAYELKQNLKKEPNPKTMLTLGEIVNMSLKAAQTEDSWEKFREYFDAVYPDLLEDLKKDFPNLSKMDLKLCALIRLNLNIKESADILALKPESIKTSRHRLRKKLNMKGEDRIYDFLIQRTPEHDQVH